jgi:hypothetical protein
MSQFKKYPRIQIAELRPVTELDINAYQQDKNIHLLKDTEFKVSISDVDISNGSPKIGDMIARNPQNNNDQWLVAKQYFEDNFSAKTTDLTFGQAIEFAKQGKKVARQGWNGSGMFAYIVPANSYPAQTEAARKEFGEMVPYRTYWALKTAQNDVATWAPSGSDSLAEDWMIVD